MSSISSHDSLFSHEDTDVRDSAGMCHQTPHQQPTGFRRVPLMCRPTVGLVETESSTHGAPELTRIHKTPDQLLSNLDEFWSSEQLRTATHNTHMIKCSKTVQKYSKILFVEKADFHLVRNTLWWSMTLSLDLTVWAEDQWINFPWNHSDCGEPPHGHMFRATSVWLSLKHRTSECVTWLTWTRSPARHTPSWRWRVRGAEPASPADALWDWVCSGRIHRRRRPSCPL